MAIRINLLAESQALEQLRRRDPVKRLIWVGVLVGVGMLVWSSTLQLKAMIAKKDLGSLEALLRGRTNEFQTVQVSQIKLMEIDAKLGKLQALATNRFLNGSMLDALQKTIIDDIRLTRLSTDHAYQLTEGTKAKTNATGRVISPAKAATVTEKITLTLWAEDTSDPPGSLVERYRRTLGEASYFRSMLSTSNDVVLKSLPPPSADPEGKLGQTFTLECHYPERARSQ
jgi:Tfp pilus assembly protein PilN